jgi:hypothetical protein
LERVLVLDANARLKGRRLTTLDVIGSGPRVVSALLNYYGFKAELHPYEHFISNKDILEEFDVLAISFMVSDIKAVKKAVDFWRKNRGRERLVILGGTRSFKYKSIEVAGF